MAGRVTLEVVLILTMTILLSWAGVAIAALLQSSDPLTALIDEAPRALFGLMGIALALWAVMVLIGAIAHRRRAVGWRILTHLVSLAIAIIVNLAVFVVLSFADPDAGGWVLLVALIAAGVGVVVAVSGTVAVLLVELVIIRPRTVAPTVAPAES